MGMTMTQKILAAAAGLEKVEAGQLIEAELDLVLGNDITSPVAIHEMDKMTVDTVFDKDKVFQFLNGFADSGLADIKFFGRVRNTALFCDRVKYIIKRKILFHVKPPCIEYQ